MKVQTVNNVDVSRRDVIDTGVYLQHDACMQLSSSDVTKNKFCINKLKFACHEGTEGQ